jgi:soluble lytic murein transglycosylase-like protein
LIRREPSLEEDENALATKFQEGSRTRSHTPTSPALKEHPNMRHFILIEILLISLLIVAGLSFSANAPTQASTEEDLLKTTTTAIHQVVNYVPPPRDIDIFLKQFDLELEFWLSIIPHKQLVYDVMDNPYGLPKAVVFALVEVESQFNPRAVGSNATSSDYGLFQLNSITYANYTPDQLLHPDNNVALGLYHLYQELERFEWDTERAVKAYNAGPTRVKQNRVPASTEAYWEKVRQAAIRYQTLWRHYYVSSLQK